MGLPARLLQSLVDLEAAVPAPSDDLGRIIRLLAISSVLPALYKAAAGGPPTLADKGYGGAGIGIRTPARRPKECRRTGVSG